MTEQCIHTLSERYLGFRSVVSMQGKSSKLAGRQDLLASAISNLGTNHPCTRKANPKQTMQPSMYHLKAS